MRLLPTAVACSILVLAAAAPQGGPTLGAPNYDKLAKLAREWFTSSGNGKYVEASKAIEKLREDSLKLAKAAKFDDPLVAVPDWREIIRRAQMAEKPTATVTARADLSKMVAVPAPESCQVQGKEFKDYCDNTTKAFVSVPGDFSKVAYPVILALHPIDPEVKALKDLTKSKVIVDRVREWAVTTYPKDLLGKAIVVVPVMDYVVRGADGVSCSRPAWETLAGTTWAFNALEIVRSNLNHDPARVFVDGFDDGARAALLLCANYPGLQTGAIVRGAPPEKFPFENCTDTPILLVGASTKALHDEWGKKERFQVQWADAIDPAALAAFVTDHPKAYAPDRVHLHADSIDTASARWLAVRGQDSRLEGVPFVVDAVVDRAKNEFTLVTSAKILSLDLFLNDELADLSQPIRVTHRRLAKEGEEAPVEKEIFKGKVARTFETMLDLSRGLYMNRGEIYVAKLSLALN